MVIINKNFKESLVRKVLENPEKSISEIARDAHISRSALYGWVRQAKESTKHSSSVVHSIPQTVSWTTEQRFQTLMDTSTLSGEELNQYCRERGIYKQQLIQWRHNFMNSSDEKQKQQMKELKQLREQNKALQRELHRKEKALAETTALLVLKKKADLIWGENGDD
jgi:transposase